MTEGESQMSMNAAALAPVTAESLNLGCACRTLNQESLQRQLEATHIYLSRAH